MTVDLPPEFLAVPIAHWAYHDRSACRPENKSGGRNRSGRGVLWDRDRPPDEMTADGEAMVFHDYVLDRLTDESGPITARTASEAKAIPLTEADGDIIPSLDDILFLVAGRSRC